MEGVSVGGFYSYQIYLKDNISDFRINDALSAITSFCDPNCTIFSVEEQLFYNKVCRVLINRLLNDHFICDALINSRIKKTTKYDLLLARRAFIQELFQKHTQE
jgi:hypothetical protein